MTTFTSTIERTDRIIEEAEEIRHESNLLIRDALPESEHQAAEARIDGYRLAIQNAANHLYLELREIEHQAQKRLVPVTGVEHSLWTLAADKGFKP